MRRRAVEEPELFVDADDPQPARRSPTRAEIPITLRFLMTRTVLLTVPDHRVGGGIDSGVLADHKLPCSDTSGQA